MDLVESGNNVIAIDQRHPWELARIEVIAQVLRDIVRLHPGDVVVDVGCGDSFVAEQIARCYPAVTVYGIDSAFDEQLLATFRRKLKVGNVRLFKSLEEAAADIGDKKATAVLLADVIEHIEDDVAFLKSLTGSALAGPQTRYVVSVPAFRFLFSAHDVLLGHYRRYSNSTLERQLRRAGLEPQLLCYFFSSLLLPRLAQAAKDRLLPSKRRTTHVAAWHGSTALQRLIKNVLVWDFQLSWALYQRGLKLPGLSNLAVCRRPA